MGSNYINERNPTSGNTFQFCQYSAVNGQTGIYENDYPVNCCGCFEEKWLVVHHVVTFCNNRT
ncbi:hypothetical protein I4U23_005283 [Adineta vaga]|nr:hypothetical protein I4U23_005283 [Adineta vaga]